MLYTMFQLFPKVRADFFSLVASKFPHIKWEQTQLTHYCIQSFKVLEYLPSMRKQLLEIVIDKCLEIDVNIKINENGEVSIDEGENHEGGGEGGDDNTSTTKEGPTTDESTEQSSKKDDIVDGFSDKLDSLLKLLLEEIRKASKDGVSAREMYYELLPVFESTILTTHKAKYVQFCMFYCCALESGIIDDENNVALQQVEHAILHRDFAAKLLETIVDAYRATLTRQSGACYLASFISRAWFVGPDTICESVSALLRWAEAYIEAVGQYGIRAADSREQSEYHSLFYTVCQAAFYIMCFRGTEAIDYHRKAVASYSSMEVAEDDVDDMHYPDPMHINLSAERWTRICIHDLQPLRYCLESVRNEFLNIARAYNLIDGGKLDTLVEDAKRLSTVSVNKRAASKISTLATLSVRRRKGGVGGLGRGSNPLKSFFPFDPLLLRRSHDFMEPFYRHWQGSVEEEDALSIDDGSKASDNEEGIFDMDDSSADDNDDNRLPAVVSDQDVRKDIEADIDNDEEDDETDGMKTPDVYEKKEMQRKAWTETTKRPRSQSMENGSW
jgi:RNA polymerase I-specific transcription initiation factor RRN3